MRKKVSPSGDIDKEVDDEEGAPRKDDEGKACRGSCEANSLMRETGKMRRLITTYALTDPTTFSGRSQ